MPKSIKVILKPILTLSNVMPLGEASLFDFECLGLLLFNWAAMKVDIRIKNEIESKNSRNKRIKMYI